jgi:hypothetical protein
MAYKEALIYRSGKEKKKSEGQTPASVEFPEADLQSRSGP